MFLRDKAFLLIPLAYKRDALFFQDLIVFSVEMKLATLSKKLTQVLSLGTEDFFHSILCACSWGHFRRQVFLPDTFI